MKRRGAEERQQCRLDPLAKKVSTALVEIKTSKWLTEEDAAGLLTITFFNASRPQMEIFEEVYLHPMGVFGPEVRTFVLMALVAGQIHELRGVILSEAKALRLSRPATGRGTPEARRGTARMEMLARIEIRVEQKCQEALRLVEGRCSLAQQLAEWTRTQNLYARHTPEHAPVVFANRFEHLTGIKDAWISLPDRRTTCRVIKRILKRLPPT